MTLKACPFCGASTGAHIDDGKYPHVLCASCGAKGPSGYDINSAKERWNIRHKERRSK